MEFTKTQKVMAIIFTLVIFAGMALIVQLSWNYVMPSLFGVGRIEYLQSLMLMVLINVLFGGYRL